MNKLLVVIIIFVGIAAVYAGLSISEEPFSAPSKESGQVESKQTDQKRIDPEVENFKQQKKTLKKADESPLPETKLAELPAKFTVSGIVYSKDLAKSYTALFVDKNVGEYYVDENINNLNVYVKRINRNSVVLEFESKDYELMLGEFNSLAEEQTLQSFNEMTPKEIGSRPRQLEHIVKTLPNLFNDGGKIIIPGANPDLYSKIRFKEGDVLLEVNGFDIDDDAQLNELQKEIRTAQTLSFKVNRAGRMITLYLDIPHEALKL